MARAIFTNSMGCRLIGPSLIQRWAPLIEGESGESVTRSRSRQKKMKGYCIL